MQNLKVYSDTIFIFDLHGVVFKLDAYQVMKEIFRTPYKYQLLKTLFYPKVVFTTYYSLKKGGVAEEVLLNLSKDLPQFQKLLPTGFNIINAQKPIQQTVSIIKKLKASGYKVCIFSNIGDHSIKMLEEKYPQIFKYFDDILGCTKKDNYIKKPSPESFRKCINFFNVDPSKIIFVDDKKINVSAATNFGIQAILFKSSQDLYKNLIKIKCFEKI